MEQVSVALLVGTAALFLAVVGTVARPASATAAGFALLLLANTKFRARSPLATLEAAVDGQVLFELVVYGVVGLITVRAALALPRPALSPRPLEWLLAGYVALATASSLWSPVPSLSLVRALQCFVMLGLAFVAVRMLTPEGAWRAFSISVIGYVLLASGIALLFPITVIADTNVIGAVERFAFFAQHPLTVATYAGVAALIVLSRILFGNSPRTPSAGKPFMWVIVFAPLAGVLLATRSRAALVGFAMAACALLAVKYIIGRPPRRTALSVGGFSVVSALIAAVVAWQIRLFATGGTSVMDWMLRGETVEQLRTLNSRTFLLEFVGTLIMERPILGHGLVASRSVLLEQFYWAGDTHNGIAESLLNVGIVGTGLLWAPFMFILARLSREALWTPPAAYRIRSGLLASAIFVLVNTTASTGFAGGANFEFLLLVVLVSVGGAPRRAPDSPPSVPSKPVRHPVRSGIPSSHRAGPSRLRVAPRSLS